MQYQSYNNFRFSFNYQDHVQNCTTDLGAMFDVFVKKYSV